MDSLVTVQMVIDMSRCDKDFFVWKLVIDDVTNMSEHLRNKKYDGSLPEIFYFSLNQTIKTMGSEDQ